MPVCTESRKTRCTRRFLAQSPGWYVALNFMRQAPVRGCSAVSCSLLVHKVKGFVNLGCFVKVVITPGMARQTCASVGVGLGKAATFVCAGPQGHRLLGQGTGWAEAHLDVRRSISPGSATTTKCMCARRSRKILPSFFAMDSSSLGACSL